MDPVAACKQMFIQIFLEYPLLIFIILQDETLSLRQLFEIRFLTCAAADVKHYVRGVIEFRVRISSLPNFVCERSQICFNASQSMSIILVRELAFGNLEPALIKLCVYDV
jgi:hypothetical protein